MDDAGGARESGPDDCDDAGTLRPEVAALVTKIRDGLDDLRALPLAGVPPALGDQPWP
jgi:hypothetical protein